MKESKELEKELGEEASRELKSLRKVQCKGSDREKYKRERRSALRLAHQIMNDEDIGFRDAEKKSWVMIKAQRNALCELPKQVEQAVNDEAHAEAAATGQSLEKLSDAGQDKPDGTELEKTGEEEAGEAAAGKPAGDAGQKKLDEAEREKPAGKTAWDKPDA